MSILMMSAAGKQAYRDLVLAMAERGANCKDDPEPWDGTVDANGVETLPSAEEVRELCAGCPLLGKECHEFLSKGNITWGALDGQIIDKWNLSGVDLFEPEEEGE